jgi:hypothetical protein
MAPPPEADLGRPIAAAGWSASRFPCRRPSIADEDETLGSEEIETHGTALQRGALIIKGNGAQEEVTEYWLTEPQRRFYVAHYNWCRVHETLDTTPAVALGIADCPWSIGDLIDAALAVAPPAPTETAPDRRRRFRVIEGGRQ